MENEKADPFADLIVTKEESINKTELASLVQGRILIVDDGTVRLEEKFEKLSDEMKIVVYLLARKIMKIKGLVETEAAGPTEISKNVNVGLSNAKKVVLKSKYLDKVKEGYLVPNYIIGRLKKELLQEGEVSAK